MRSIPLHRLAFLSLCVFLGIVPGLVTRAASAQTERTPTVEEEAAALMQQATTAGSALSHEQAISMVQQGRAAALRAKQIGEELAWTPPSSQDAILTPLSHTAGKEGIPFPKPEDVLLKPIPTADILTPTPEPVSTPEPYRKPGRCEKSETRREVFEPGAGESQLLYDILFVSEDLVPLEPDEVFGAKVELNPYGPNSSKASEIRMEIYNVPCLPYRIRMTNVAYYYDSGLHALKNYSKNQAGRGELHPVMSSKLFPSMGNTPAKRPLRPR